MHDRLKIAAFKDNKYSLPPKLATVVVINPASYTHEHKVNYNEDVPIGAPGTPLMFKCPRKPFLLIFILMPQEQ